VVGFEPQPANHRRLLTNIALNRLANVRVFQLALAERSGEIQIYGERGTATVVARAAAIHPSAELATVRAMRGDDLRAKAQLPIPKAVKIDVEGAEFGVLTGLRETLSSPLCELLCLEIHPRFVPPEVSTERVLSLVRSLGFNRIETRPRGTEIHLIAEKETAQVRCVPA
jgi:FkbM family methyltransferase